MTGADFLAAELCRRCYLDGHSEGLNGCLAIAHVFKHRERAGWYSGNWAEILSHHAEVSYRKDPPTDTLPDPRKFDFQTLLQEVPRIFSGAQEDNITRAQDSIFNYARPGGSPYQISVSPAPAAALYFAKMEDITSEWFLANVSLNHEKHQRIAQVGGLTFWT